ncbi:MAG: MarR family winged helix-turn-helix transcriptional regulator [Christensenellales bacterium]
MNLRFREFTVLLSNIGRAINKIKNYEMSKFGLKGSQVNCIFYLYGNEDGMTATELCNLCEEDKAGVSRALKDLEEKGYVECKSDENKKKYNSNLKLTPKGEEVAEFISGKINDIINYDKNYISDEELKSFYNTFNKIYDNLKIISDKE